MNALDSFEYSLIPHLGGGTIFILDFEAFLIWFLRSFEDFEVKNKKT